MPTAVRVGSANGLLRSVSRIAVKAAAAIVGLVVIGNMSILAASWWAHRTAPASTERSVQGVANLQMVDDRLWRGAAPSAEGYRDLAALGITTVVDLRAEHGAAAEEHGVRSLGMRYVHLPIHDGQLPSSGQVSEFLRLVEAAPGPVFVHCGAGVGRTGVMVGAYLVAGGEAPERALRRNLAVGPPSLEQVVFVAGLDGDGFDRVGTGVTALSRILDFPRRALHVIGI